MNTYDKQMRHPLTNIFKDELRFFASRSTVGAMLHNLFSFCNENHLEEQLEYLTRVFNGEDDYFKERGKELWFTVFHSSITKADFYVWENIFLRKNTETLNEDEMAEFRYLQFRFNVQKEPKMSKVVGEHFTVDYCRFLDLHGRLTDKFKEESISGKMDMMLYNLIALDCGDENILYRVLTKTFAYSGSEDKAVQVIMKAREDKAKATEKIAASRKKMKELAKAHKEVKGKA